MKIVIDGYEDLVIAEDEETLGELLTEIEKWIRDNKRIIVQARLEGKLLSWKDRKNIFHRRAGEFKILELFTANLWQWTTNSLNEIRRYLPEIATNMEKTSLLIQRGDYKNAFSLLDNCINLWNWVNETLQKIEKIFALDYTQISLKRGRLSDKIREFLNPLREANKAIKKGDLLGLSDILEYELAPRLKEQQEIVREITKLLKQQMN